MGWHLEYQGRKVQRTPEPQRGVQRAESTGGLEDTGHSISGGPQSPDPEPGAPSEVRTTLLWEERERGERESCEFD